MEHNIKTCNECKCELTDENKQNKYRRCKNCHSSKEKERNLIYRLENKYHIDEYDKQYRETNKEKIKERAKQYVENNRERINEQSRKRMKERLTCSCGQVLSRSSFKKHQTAFNHFYPNIDRLGGTQIYYCWDGKEWIRINVKDLDNYKDEIWIPRILKNI